MGGCTALFNEILDQLFGGSDYAEPGTWYLGLATAVNAAGAITGEPSGSNYSRVTILNNTDNWNVAGSGLTDNKVDFTFPEASGAWGTPTKWFLSASSSGGTALIYGPITVPKAIVDGSIPKFSAGYLDISMVDNDD